MTKVTHNLCNVIIETDAITVQQLKLLLIINDVFQINDTLDLNNNIGINISLNNLKHYDARIFKSYTIINDILNDSMFGKLGFKFNNGLFTVPKVFYNNYIMKSFNKKEGKIQYFELDLNNVLSSRLSIMPLKAYLKIMSHVQRGFNNQHMNKWTIQLPIHIKLNKYNYKTSLFRILPNNLNCKLNKTNILNLWRNETCK